jgi:hypothetical protein
MTIVFTGARIVFTGVTRPLTGVSAGFYTMADFFNCAEFNGNAVTFCYTDEVIRLV